MNKDATDLFYFLQIVVVSTEGFKVFSSLVEAESCISFSIVGYDCDALFDDSPSNGDLFLDGEILERLGSECELPQGLVANRTRGWPKGKQSVNTRFTPVTPDVRTST